MRLQGWQPALCALEATGSVRSSPHRSPVPSAPIRESWVRQADRGTGLQAAVPASLFVRPEPDRVSGRERILRKAKAHTRKALVGALGEGAQGFFEHCGYRSCSTAVKRLPRVVSDASWATPRGQLGTVPRPSGRLSFPPCSSLHFRRRSPCSLVLRRFNHRSEDGPVAWTMRAPPASWDLCPRSGTRALRPPRRCWWGYNPSLGQTPALLRPRYRSPG